ncbi:MAG: alpha/beta hydrolase family protein, partial [Candidatus Hydrogenedens sp.]
EKVENPLSVLLLHGTKDMIVPFLQSKNFYEKIRAIQWDCKLIVKENAPHIWKGMSEDFVYLGKWFLERLNA